MSDITLTDAMRRRNAAYDLEPRRLVVVQTDDGCYRRDLSNALPNMGAALSFMRQMIRGGYTAEELDIVDLETGRFVSYILEY